MRKVLKDSDGKFQSSRLVEGCFKQLYCFGFVNEITNKLIDIVSFRGIYKGLTIVIITAVCQPVRMHRYRPLIGI